MRIENGRRGAGRRRSASIAVTATVSAVVTALLLPLGGAAQTQTAPANTSPPTISGTASKGETLVAGTGSWSGTTPISFSFEWRRCDSAGANCSAIAGATNTTYVLQGADVGARIRVSVSASNSDGTATALSDPTSVVSSGGVPVNTGEPAISGSPVVGQKLTGTNGSWTGDQPMTFAFQWVRCGSDGGAPDGSNCAVISGATSSSYTLGSGDAGGRMRVRVTATNSAGSTTVASNATSPVSASAPVNTKAPSISGSTVNGATLTANRGTWSGAGTISYSYRWLRCDANGNNCGSISGATGTQYKLTSTDVGRKLRVTVTARNGGGSTSATSGPTATVVPAGPSGVVTLPSGEKSIPVTSVPNTARLIVSQVVFSPRPVRSAVDPITVRIRVKDTNGYVVRDALVFVRSTPRVTSGGDGQKTATDGWVSYQLVPNANFPRPRSGYNVQFFAKAYRAGDPALAGVAAYRLVQVPLGG